jgi:septal ring factor EnvC (AmiA/AmiB activator)
MPDAGFYEITNMDDILDILIPIFIFVGFYIFARLQKFLKEVNKGGQQNGKTQLNTAERLKRRMEALAVKQAESEQKTGRVRQANQQKKKNRQTPAPVQEQTRWQSEEEMIEKLGLIEFERREALGEIPDSIRRKAAAEAPKATAAHHSGVLQMTGAGSLRRMILAKEILDPPVSMRPRHNPFRK